MGLTWHEIERITYFDITSNSNAPHLIIGNIIAIDTSQNIVITEDYFLVKSPDNKELLVKFERKGNLIIMSTNTFSHALSSDFEIIGKMVKSLRQNP